MFKLGPYEVLDLLGRGGMGSVHRARGPDGRIVAVKLLKRGGDVARFRREERLQESLGEEAGFVPLLDAGEAPQGSYLVMPYLAGGTLRARLAKGPLGVAETLRVGRALAGAMGRAHALGIVHRDLKPENVLFTQEGRPLVADLGLAKHFRLDVPGASRSVSMSQEGHLRGTLGYAPAEQLGNARDVGPEADVFALGAILHECLAGEPAFTGVGVLDVIAKIERSERTPLDATGAPKSLLAVLDRALARDTARRYASGDELLRALEGVREDGRRSLRGVALCVALALVAAGAIAALRGREPLREGAAPSTPGPVAQKESVSAFSPFCTGFLRSKHLRLVQVLGEYDGKPADEIRAAAFTPKGDRIVTALGYGTLESPRGFDSTLVLWDVATGAELLRFEGHGASVTGCAFTPRGQLVSGALDEKIMVWDPATGARLGTIDAKSPVLAIAVPTSGSLVVAATAAGLAAFDLESGEAVAREASGPVLAVAYSADARTVVAGDKEGRVRLWIPGAAVRELGRHEAPVRAVAFAPDGSCVYAASEDGVLDRWDLNGESSTLEKSPVALCTLLVTRDRVVSAGLDQTILVHDARTGERLRRVEDSGGCIYALALAPDGRRLFAGGWLHILRYHDLETGERLPPLASPCDVRLAVVPGGRILAGGYEGSLTLWDTERARRIWTVPAHKQPVFALAVSPDGSQALSGAHDGYLDLHDTSTGRLETHLIEPKHGRIFTTCFSADGKTAFAGGDDGILVAVDVATGAERIVGQRGATVAFIVPTPDGEYVLVGAQPGLRLVSLRSNEAIAARPEALSDMATFTNGGRSLLVATQDGVLSWLDPLTLKVEKETLPSGRSPGMTVVGDRWVVAPMADGSVDLRALPGGERLDRIDLGSAHDWGVHTIAAPDGKSFFMATMRGVVLRFAIEE